MRWQERLVAILAIVYALLFVVWRALEASPSYSQWWPLQVSEIFGMWTLLPLPFLLALALVWRSRWVWLALLIPVIWFGREYGGLFLPPTYSVARASADDPTLRLMTFNTLYLYLRNKEFMAAVEQWQPDIFVLQEANPYFVKLIGEVADEWPYHERASVRVGGRVAIFSKWPILSIKNDNDIEGCHCAEALVDLNGKTIRVIVVHIRAPTFGRRIRSGIPPLTKFDASHQATTYGALLPLIKASSEPVIVLGDFNTTERQSGYQAIYDAGLKDAHQEAGWGLGLTYPAPFSRFSWLPISLLRIDHIFYDAAWRALWTRTMPLMGSDHQAVLADLKWVSQE